MNRVIERILNLLAFLLTVGKPVTADQIRHTVAGYDQETDEAFRRTFERDKDLLRSLGVPLRMEHTDAWEVEQGYVVAPDEYALEDPGLTDDERAALWVAATMVRLGGQAAGPSAIFKLGGAPLAATGEPLTADLGSDPEVLGELLAAVSDQRRISFSYRGSKRTVDPYGLAHRRGHWYVIGHTDEGLRVFRVDRMSQLATGEVAGAFARPAGFRMSNALPSLPWSAGEDDVRVTVRFDADIAWWAGRQLGPQAIVEQLADGSVDAVFAVAHKEAFFGWLVSFDDQAELIAPSDLRREFAAHVAGGS